MSLIEGELVRETREIFNSGLTKSSKFRLAQLGRFKDFLKDNEDELVKHIVMDTRKLEEEARIEVLIGVNHVRFLISNLRDWMKPRKVKKRLVDILDRIYIVSEALGVVLIMGAWNVPLMTLLPVAGAISAGNCVVIKPSHLCPNFCSFLFNTLPKYLHPKCYPVFTGDIPSIKSLLTHRFDYIYYTGSATIGKIVYSAANQHLTPVTLELGGKNPVYIDQSAHIKLAVKRILWAKCFMSGHVCIAPDYILCDKTVEKEFLEHSAEVLRSFGADYTMRRIFNDAHFKRLVTLMKDLKIAIGGFSDPLDNLIELSIAIDVDPEHPIMKEEVFGPVLPIVNIKSLEEAVCFINRREKALFAYIFSENSTDTRYFIKNTSSGSVSVNDCLMDLVVERLPFGGVGNSGMGKYKGKNSFDMFSNNKSVLERSSFWLVEYIQGIRYPPFSKQKTKIGAKIVRFRNDIDFKWIKYLISVLIGVLIGYLMFRYVI